jgi:hypothetical protein
MAHKVELDAVSWITPPPLLDDRNFAGKPNIPTSQSNTCVSSSVQAGLVAQSIPWTPSADDNRSPKMAGPDALAGKNAKNLGDCQCVTPGRTTESTSCKS